MKNLKFNNPFSEKSKENRHKLRELRLVARLEKKYQSKSYSDKFRPMKQVANLTSYLFNLYSFSTGFVALLIIGFGLFAALPYPAKIALTIVLGAGVAVAVELGKRNLLSNFFKDGYFEGSWKKGYLAGLFVLMAISFALTIFAAWNSPRFFTTAPVAISTDTTGYKFYTDEIARKTAEIAHIREERKYKGILANKDQIRVDTLNSQILALQEQFISHRTEAEEKAEKATAANLEAYNGTKDSQQWMLVYIAIATELLLILVFWYSEFYDWQAVEERTQVNPHTGEMVADAAPYPVDIPAVEHQATPTPATVTGEAKNRKKIGFNFYDENANDFAELKEIATINVNRLNEDSNGITEIKEYNLQPNQKPCLYCGNVMNYKSVTKKFCSTNCRVKYHKENKRKA